MSEMGLVVELAKRLNGIAVVSSDINESDISGIDIEALTSHSINFFKDYNGSKILQKDILTQIIAQQKKEHALLEHEIVKPENFEPIAKRESALYSMRSIPQAKSSATVSDFTNYFDDRYKRLRHIIERGWSSKMAGLLNNISNLKNYMSGREVCIAGMVYDRIITKNGNVLATIEDETGVARVIFNKMEKEGPGGTSLFKEGQKLVKDEVVAIRGKISGDFLIANHLYRPDVPIRVRKQTEKDVAIAFMSDVHVGSRFFMDKQFNQFLEWINGNVEDNRQLAEKIKYLVISGDLVDGIGVYPSQEKELSITNIYNQYEVLFDLLSKIPEYVHIFILTGNHDAVQRAEPQPVLHDEYVKNMRSNNMHLLSNPGYVTLEGLKVLAYHGTSLDSMIRSVAGCSYSKPEGAMIETLKRRHLSPIYGDNPIVPTQHDSMIIDEVPDILHMGHLHKNGAAEYHGTLVVNSGTWQARTGLRVKMGHMPTPAMLPVYETKTAKLSTVDFNTMVE